jgi:hypothetical protein
MSAHVSPFLLARIDQASQKELIGEPILTCPRCRFSLSRGDLIASDLWAEKAIHSPADQFLVIINSWPCLSCGTKLYRTNVQLKDMSNKILGKQIEAAVNGLHHNLELTKTNWRLSEFVHQIAKLLAQIESRNLHSS